MEFPEELKQTIMLVHESMERLDVLEAESAQQFDGVLQQLTQLSQQLSSQSSSSVAEHPKERAPRSYDQRARTRWRFIMQADCIIETEVTIRDHSDKNHTSRTRAMKLWRENPRQPIGLCTQCKHSEMFMQKSFDGADFQTAMCDLLPGRLMGVSGCELALADKTFALVSSEMIQSKLRQLNEQRGIELRTIESTGLDEWVYVG